MSEYRSITESKNAPNRVTYPVRLATSPSTISKIPANRTTSPAHVNMPLAKRTAAKILMNNPISVRMLGFTRKAASRFTIEPRIQVPACSEQTADGGIPCRLHSALLIVECCKPQDLEGPAARRNLYFDFVAFFLVQEALADGRRC